MSRRQHTKDDQAAGDVERALGALDAEQLRELARVILSGVDADVRARIEDFIVKHASAKSAFRPAAPDAALVDEVKRFVSLGRRVGEADPETVDHFLRSATKASLAGDYPTARAVFDALFESVGGGEIMLGQHEMVEEVLSVDLHDCASRYLLSVYLSSTLHERAEALLDAAARARGMGAYLDPLKDVEAAHGRPLPDAGAFLDAWIAALEGSEDLGDDWPSDHDRWLLDAVTRRDGSGGLGALARRTKRADALRAWCDALVEAEDWTAALDAYEEAARLVTKDYERGEFLDGAAFVAARLTRKDLSNKLENAWARAPSLPRLLRWLAPENTPAEAIRARAKAALEDPPTKAPSLLGLLHVLGGDVKRAAKLLADAPGLGWSDAAHPGHVLFPAFALLLGEGSKGSATSKSIATLASPPHEPFDLAFDLGDDAAPVQRSRAIAAPTVHAVLRRAEAAKRIGAAQRDELLHAMRRAAKARLDGVTGQKRRRHYGHAASLIACVEELGGPTATAWVEGLRKETSRFYAFQEELRAARAGAVDKPPPPRRGW